MIYTVGHKANYEAAIREHGRIKKTGKTDDGYPGGVCFRTYEDALNALTVLNPSGSWCVWGLDAEWYADTYSRGGWQHLRRHAWVIELDDDGNPRT